MKALFFFLSLVGAHSALAVNLDGCWKVRDRNGESPMTLKFDRKYSHPDIGVVYELSLHNGTGWRILGQNLLTRSDDGCGFLRDPSFAGDRGGFKYQVRVELSPSPNSSQCRSGELDESRLDHFEILLDQSRMVSSTQRSAQLTDKIECPVREAEQ